MFKKITSLLIALLMSTSCVAVAGAAEATPSAEEVFPAEQVNELQEQNDNQLVYNDKDVNVVAIAKVRETPETNVETVAEGVEDAADADELEEIDESEERVEDKSEEDIDENS